MRPEFKALVCAVSILLSAAMPSYALALGGGVLMADVSPGDHINHTIGISSGKNDSPMNITVEILDMKQGLRGETLAANLSGESPLSANSSAREYLTVRPTRIHLEPGSSQGVIVAGDIPENAAPGGRYALINVKGLLDRSGASGGRGGITFGIAINGIVELIVSGDRTDKTGEISELRALDPSPGRQENFTMMYNNTGNVHYRITVDEALKDSKGGILSNASMTSGIPVMPGASRKIDFSLSAEKELAAGAYAVNATVRLGDGTVLATKETKFSIG